MDEIGKRRWNIECEIARLDERLSALEAAAPVTRLRLVPSPTRRLVPEARRPRPQATGSVVRLGVSCRRRLQAQQ